MAPTATTTTLAPAQSSDAPDRWRPLPRSGTTATAAIKATAPSTISSKKSARQPTAAMRGPPRATPITGPPAPTRDHHPMALTRSPGSKAPSTSAIDEADRAAPTMPPSARAATRAPTSGDSAEATATSTLPTMPNR